MDTADLFVLAILFGGSFLFFLLLLYLLRILKQQKQITKNLKFQESFSSRQAPVSALLILLPLSVAGAFFCLLCHNILAGYFFRSGLKSQVVQLCVLLFCLVVALYQLCRLIGLFRKKITVDGPVIQITNGFGTFHQFTSDKIISLQLGGRRAASSCFLYIEFYDEKGRRRKFDMYLYWEPFLLFKLWVQKYYKPGNKS